MKRILSFLSIMVGLLIVAQGLFLKQIIPLEPFLLLTGISSNTLGLFVIPLLIFSGKFIYLIFSPFVILVVKWKNNINKGFDPNLPSASVLGSQRFNLSKDLMDNLHSFFTSLISEFFRWALLFVLALTIVGLYVYLDLVENNQEGIFPLLLNVITGFSLILLPSREFKKICRFFKN